MLGGGGLKRPRPKLGCSTIGEDVAASLSNTHAVAVSLTHVAAERGYMGLVWSVNFLSSYKVSGVLYQEMKLKVRWVAEASRIVY